MRPLADPTAGNGREVASGLARRLTDVLAEFLRIRRPFALCDACLAQEFSTSVEEVMAAGLTLVRGGPEFRRDRRLCSRCNRLVDLTCAS